MGEQLTSLTDRLCKMAIPLLQPYGLRRLALFGSQARQDAGSESDIDLLVELASPHPRPLGLLGWQRLEGELSQLLGRKVDLVSLHGLSGRRQAQVLGEAVTLYEAP